MLREANDIPSWLSEKINFSIQKSRSLNRKSISLIVDRECPKDIIKNLLESNGFKDIHIFSHKNLSHLHFKI